jgi:hypothetical protein
LAPGYVQCTCVSGSIDWKKGDRCKAIYAADGNAYEAVIVDLAGTAATVSNSKCRTRH